ncbi:MAG TPA: hypothetical protein VGX00_05410 [Thermoplasmata archaeon]|nr:hypothetical protein [Thermoplasmata archaeon]
MGRTVRDYQVAGTSVAAISQAVHQWYQANQFRILDENADGTARTYDAPEIGYGARTRGYGGHLRFPAPPGSIVGLNVAAAGSGTPTAFAISIAPDAGGVRIHGEFFSPIRLESLGGGGELELINTIWAPAGVQRKKAYVLLVSFEKFIGGLRAPLPSG